MNTLQRIKHYLEYKGISNQKFEKSIGLSNGAFGTQLKNNRTIGVDKIEKMLDTYPDLNPTWLLTADGEMIKDVSGQVVEVAKPGFLDLISELKQKELTHERRMVIADEVLTRWIELSEDCSRVKGEMLQVLKKLDKF